MGAKPEVRALILLGLDGATYLIPDAVVEECRIDDRELAETVRGLATAGVDAQDAEHVIVHHRESPPEAGEGTECDDEEVVHATLVGETETRVRPWIDELVGRLMPGMSEDDIYRPW